MNPTHKTSKTLSSDEPDWNAQYLSDRHKTDEQRYLDQLESLKEILKGFSQLKSFSLKQHLAEAAKASETNDETTLILRRLLDVYQDRFHLALEQLGIDDPIAKIRKQEEARIKAAAEAKRKEQEKTYGENADLVEPDYIPGSVPKGYKKWDVKKMEDFENETIAFWTIEGVFGKGEIFIHEKRRHEYCFRPQNGTIFLLTENHRRKITPEGKRYRFKELIRS